MWWVLILLVQCLVLACVVYHFYIIILNHKRKESDPVMFVYISILLFLLVSFHYLFEALSIVLDRTGLTWPVVPACMAVGIGLVASRSDGSREDEYLKKKK
jgi:hypothetical protein